MQYLHTFDDIASGDGTTPTWKTVAGIIVPDTANLRVRLDYLDVWPRDAPSNINCLVRLVRSLDVSVDGAGTAGTTVAAANISKADPDAQDSIASVKENYSSEPGFASTEPLWLGVFNDGGGIIKRWFDSGRPMATRDMALYIQFTRVGAGTMDVSGAFGFSVV